MSPPLWTSSRWKSSLKRPLRRIVGVLWFSRTVCSSLTLTDQCRICLEHSEESKGRKFVLTKCCNQPFHAHCFKEHLQWARNDRCPQCQRAIPAMVKDPRGKPETFFWENPGPYARQEWDNAPFERETIPPEVAGPKWVDMWYGGFRPETMRTTSSWDGRSWKAIQRHLYNATFTLLVKDASSRVV